MGTKAGGFEGKGDLLTVGVDELVPVSLFVVTAVPGKRFAIDGKILESYGGDLVTMRNGVSFRTPFIRPPGYDDDECVPTERTPSSSFVYYFLSVGRKNEKITCVPNEQE